MHTKRTIVIRKEDHERLERLFADDITDSNKESNLLALREEFDSVAIVDPKEAPPDVVTLVSTTRLCNSRRRYENSYTLVHPEDVAITDGHLTVLDSIVSVIPGYRVGDDAYWPVPG